VEILCYSHGSTEPGTSFSKEKQRRINFRTAASWGVISASARGAKHVKDGTLNQDSVAVAFAPIPERGLVIACADGHGGEPYFRSHRGSQLACAAATNCGLKLLDKLNADSQKEISVADGKILVQRIYENWLSAVKCDREQNAFTEREWGMVPEDELRHFKEYPETAYGTTLLVVIAWTSGLMALQLGDGDIVLVTDQGLRHLVPRIETNGPGTDSLCDPASVEKFRVYLDLFENGVPPYVLVTTDGWSNAFENESEELATDLDIVRWLKTSAASTVESGLPGVLEQISEKGWSDGDDVSLAILFDKTELRNED
jgi:hypothetical protein